MTKHYGHHNHYKYLHVPDHWEHYWSKYPNGYTLLEALISWTSQVNDMIESYNHMSDDMVVLNRNFKALDKELRASWAGYKDHTEKTYSDFREEILTIINNWIASIEPDIQNTVVNLLNGWLSDGTLADIINEDVFNMKANQSDLDTTNQEIANARTDLNNETHPTLSERLNDNFKELTKDRQLTATLGEELSSDNYTLGVGWSGNASVGFKHTPGNTAQLSIDIGAERGVQYIVEFDTNVMIPQYALLLKIGASEAPDIYRGDIRHYAVAVKAGNGTALSFNPVSTLAVTISNISIKRITGQIPLNYDLALNAKDANNAQALEYRATSSSLNNIYFGKRAGRFTVTAFDNVSLGHNALEFNSSGFWNTAIGTQSLQQNVSGSRNIGIGIYSLTGNVAGNRNIGVGTYALNRITEGSHNIGIGADTAWYTTTGNGNIALGTTALEKNISGSENIAIGYRAMREKTNTNYNIAIGAYAQDRSTAGTSVIAIGYESLMNVSGSNNTGIGHQAFRVLTTGTENIAIGRLAGSLMTSGTNNTFIGTQTGRFKTGENNTIVGANAGSTLYESGTNNILIGANADVPADDTSNFLNVGNVITGNTELKLVTVGGGQAHTATLRVPKVANYPQLLLDSGDLIAQPKTGAIEFDGTNLYITVAGQRKQIQLV